MSMRLFLLLVVFSVRLAAQETRPPYWNEIQAFKKQDSTGFPGTGKILFVGSSSFTNWKDVQNYFPGYPVINRGFGGSTLPDVIRYSDDVIIKYRPKQIVIYCGENDLAASDTVSAEMVVARFKELFSLIRSRFKKVPVVFISLKPSSSRQHLMPKMLAANLGIRNYLGKKKKTVFVDVYHNMLNPDGSPLKDIFTDDQLHMNARGYAIWQKLIEPHLLK